MHRWLQHYNKIRKNKENLRSIVLMTSLMTILLLDAYKITKYQQINKLTKENHIFALQKAIRMWIWPKHAKTFQQLSVSWQAVSVSHQKIPFMAYYSMPKNLDHTFSQESGIRNVLLNQCFNFSLLGNLTINQYIYTNQEICRSMHRCLYKWLLPAETTLLTRTKTPPTPILLNPSSSSFFLWLSNKREFVAKFSSLIKIKLIN